MQVRIHKRERGVYNVIVRHRRTDGLGIRSENEVDKAQIAALVADEGLKAGAVRQARKREKAEFRGV